MTRGAIARGVRVAGLTFLAAMALGACAAEAVPPASIVTFEVADGSRYKVLVKDPVTLRIVTDLEAGKDAPNIPSGRIVHSTEVNTGWSWALDPADFTFVDVTDGTCDGTPAEIEAGTFDGDRFCPWSAVVVDVTVAP